jgi:hypothetical protein
MNPFPVRGFIYDKSKSFLGFQTWEIEVNGRNVLN